MDFKGHILFLCEYIIAIDSPAVSANSDITDDINYVNTGRVLSMSSSFSNMLIFEIYLKCRDNREKLSFTLEKRK